ncbi:MAG: flagellar hook basal-body protein [Alphaproteobacteria bacterium]
MENTGYVALSRQLALQNHLSVLAHNIANANTTGFLGDDLTFQQVLSRAEPGREIAFVQDLTPMPDLSEGELRMTQSPLDFAIGRDGMFAVETERGIRYTRAGQFRLDEQNRIVTFDGDPVLDVNDQPIELPGGVERLEVGKDGTLSIDGEVLGQFRRASFEEPERLEREGAMLFKTDEAPGVAADAEIYQGALEASNVQPILAMTRLMETTRAFQKTQKLIETQHEMTRKSVERQLDVRG